MGGEGKVEPLHISHFSLDPSISPVVRNDETKEPKQTRRKTRRAVPRPKSKSLFLIPPTTTLASSLPLLLQPILESGCR